jgi:hypothetical protein
MLIVNAVWICNFTQLHLGCGKTGKLFEDISHGIGVSVQHEYRQQPPKCANLTQVFAAAE